LSVLFSVSFLKKQSHKREILEQRWLKPQTQSGCSDDDHKPPAKKKKLETYALPDDIIEWVKSLKVKELQEDLQSRDIETNGLKLKKDLRKRLLEALESERMMSQQPPQQQQPPQHNQQQQQKQRQQHPDDVSVPMEVEVAESCDQSSVGQANSECGLESNMAVAPQPEIELESGRMSVEYVDQGVTDVVERKQPVVIGRAAAAEIHSDETMADLEPETVVPVPEPPAKENTLALMQSPKPRSRSPLKKVGSKVQSCIKALRSHRGGGGDKKHDGDDKVPLLAPHDSNIEPASSHQPPSKYTAAAVDKLQSEFRRPSKLSKGSSASKVAHLKAQQEARRAKMEEIRSKVRSDDR
jgi:hypothetical protein